MKSFFKLISFFFSFEHENKFNMFRFVRINFKLYFMKKILLTMGVFTSITFALRAQSLLNGGFESAFIPWELVYPTVKYENSFYTEGWNLVGNGTSDLTKKATGNQSLKLVTADAPILAGVLNEPGMGTVVTGITDQIILSPPSGPFLNPDKIKLSFQFQYSTAGSDEGSVGIVIYDTLQVGKQDDKVLFEGAVDLNTNVSTWTEYTLTPLKQSDGNANRIYVIMLSSKNGYYPKTTPATAGTTLWIDDVKLLNLASSSINENVISDLNVYPNPASDVLNFDTEEEIESVVITSIDGKVALTAKSSVVNIADLKSGVYVYRVTTVSGKQSIENFIKE
jgi:hypothetical protein